MPGKSKKKRYAEFRVFVEWRRRGKYAIRPEFVPSLAAWLLMIGMRYDRAIEGMQSKLLTETVPGHTEAIATLRVCQAHIQRLLNTLPENFDQDDWKPAVAQICSLMNVTPLSTPLPEVPAGQFEHLITDEPDGR